MKTIKYALGKSVNGKESPKEEVCFARLKAPNRIGMGWDYLTYYPKFNVTKEAAREYFKELQKIGFFVSESIVDRGKYTTPLYREGIYGTDTWILANLTVIRYVDEFPYLVADFLSICKEFPCVSRWNLFQLAHSFETGRWDNDNHALMPLHNFRRFKSWQLVINQLEKRTAHRRDQYENFNLHATFCPEMGGPGSWIEKRSREQAREKLTVLLQNETK